MTADPHRLRHLKGCHPALIERIQHVIQAMEVLGYELLLTQGVRTVAQQQALYRQGRTRPGKIVTNCDGIVRRSNHQVKADGFGHAVDVAWRIDDEVTWEGPWAILGAVAANNDLVWGGNWRTFPDRPHLELPPSSVPTAGNG